MELRSLAIALCLAALGALAPLRESLAEPKIDLEAHLGSIPAVDDFKVWASESETFTNTTEAVSPGPKRTLVATVQTDGDSTWSDLDVVVHGKKLLGGTSEFDDGVDVITFLVAKPKKRLAFRMKPGKNYPFNIPSKVLFNGERVAKGREYGQVTFLGFEDVTTPLGTFEDAAHLLVYSNIRIKGGGVVLEETSAIEQWIVPVIGGVRFIQSTSFFENGVLTEVLPTTEFLFDHGVILGEPIPEPSPDPASQTLAR